MYEFLNNLHLIPVDEHFTELYFDSRATSSPEMLIPGKKIGFTFSIHNLEGKDTDYPYIVYFKNLDGTTDLIDQRTVTLKDNEVKKIAESYTIKKTKQIGYIVVYLKLLDQDVHFLVPDREFLPDDYIDTYIKK